MRLGFAVAAVMLIWQQASANIVVNGDFSAGNTGFTTEFGYSLGDIGGAETYDIVVDPADSHPHAYSYGDHTTGSGLMMAVNGTASPPKIVWSQTVSVPQNQSYEFSVWTSTWARENLRASLEVHINGLPISPAFYAPSILGVWVPFSATWNSGDSTTAVITVFNVSGGSSGNDFALDDIAFEEQPEVDLTLTPSGSVTIPRGEVLSFNSYIENTRETTVEGDQWLSIVMPDSSQFLIPEDLLNYENPLHGQVFGNSFVDLNNQLLVPMRADTGFYQLIGRVGVYPNTIIDEESFEFQVIE